MTRIILKTLPLSVNRSYKSGNGRFYKSQEAKDAQEDMAMEALIQWKRPVIKNAVGLSIHFYWPDMRRHDIDGGLKATLDSLTGIVYEDDSQIREMVVRKSFDKEKPRVEIEVIELG